MATRMIVCGAAGRMGRTLIGQIAVHPSAVLAGAVEAVGHPALGKDAGETAGAGSLGVMTTADLGAVTTPETVTLDFTTAEATLEHLRVVVARGGAMVIGSTGFTAAQHTELEGLAGHIRCVIAPNMSVGIAVLQRLAQEAAQALGDEFDCEIVEMHHRMKVDAPSGTALALGRSIAEATGRELAATVVYGREGITGQRPPQQIGILALRGGDVVGDHTVVFAGAGERIELTHRAHSRECLAGGAIRAAQWVVRQPVGSYGMRDVLGWR